MRDRLGIVSNCWRMQLDEGSRIESLIERAMQFGLRQFELRQGALGDCETVNRDPIPERLGSLAEHFPEAEFNIAVEMSVVTGTPSVNVDFQARCIAAAAALALPSVSLKPHLRIVDLSGSTVATDDARSRALDEIVTMNETLREECCSAVLSLEHSIQPWPEFRVLFDESRSAVDLKLCFDPCNLWLCDRNPPLREIVNSIPVEAISMLHVKQRDRDSNTILPGLDAGVVPWPEPVRQLEAAGYTGPILFETASCPDIFSQTEANCRQVEQWLGGN